jgi:prepilin-type N-terminal cleavage/methylation domain-containing protein
MASTNAHSTLAQCSNVLAAPEGRPQTVNMPYRQQRHRGFSLVELMFVIVISLIVAGMAIPTFLTIERNLRTSGDARDINGEIVLTKMRAASAYTKARVYADLSAQTFRVERWDKTAGSWTNVNEGGTQSLAQGVTFGFGGLGSPPAGTQAAIGQAPACLNSGGAAIANTACVVFNSRGIPVDSTGAPTPNDALYITDGRSVYVVTVSATGLTQPWRTDAQTASWKKR